MKLSTAQQRLLAWSGRGCFVHRGDVRTARSLMALDLGHLDDNGELRPGGRSDGERWFFSPTDAGRAALIELASRSR